MSLILPVYLSRDTNYPIHLPILPRFSFLSHVSLFFSLHFFMFIITTFHKLCSTYIASHHSHPASPSIANHYFLSHRSLHFFSRTSLTTFYLSSLFSNLFHFLYYHLLSYLLIYSDPSSPPSDPFPFIPSRLSLPSCHFSLSPFPLLPSLLSHPSDPFPISSLLPLPSCPFPSVPSHLSLPFCPLPLIPLYPFHPFPPSLPPPS